MVDLFVLLMKKPLEAVVAALCILVVGVQVGLFEVQEEQAVLQEQQKYDDQINTRVIEMDNMLIRIDENVKIMKEQQLRILDAALSAPTI